MNEAVPSEFILPHRWIGLSLSGKGQLKAKYTSVSGPVQLLLAQAQAKRGSSFN